MFWCCVLIAGVSCLWLVRVACLFVCCRWLLLAGSSLMCVVCCLLREELQFVVCGSLRLSVVDCCVCVVDCCCALLWVGCLLFGLLLDVWCWFMVVGWLLWCVVVCRLLSPSLAVCV